LRLIVGGWYLAADQCLDQGGEIVAGRDDAPGRRGVGRVLAGAVVGLEGSGPSRGLEVGRVRLVHQVTEGAAAVQVAVRVGIGEAVRGTGGEQGILQTQRSEQTVLETTGQRLAVDLFRNEAEQRVVGVGVV